MGKGCLLRTLCLVRRATCTQLLHWYSGWMNPSELCTPQSTQLPCAWGGMDKRKVVLCTVVMGWMWVSLIPDSFLFPETQEAVAVIWCQLGRGECLPSQCFGQQPDDNRGFQSGKGNLPESDTHQSSSAPCCQGSAEKRELMGELAQLLAYEYLRFLCSVNGNCMHISNRKRHWKMGDCI